MASRTEGIALLSMYNDEEEEEEEGEEGEEGEQQQHQQQGEGEVHMEAEYENERSNRRDATDSDPSPEGTPLVARSPTPPPFVQDPYTKTLAASPVPTASPPPTQPFPMSKSDSRPPTPQQQQVSLQSNSRPPTPMLPRQVASQSNSRPSTPLLFGHTAVGLDSLGLPRSRKALAIVDYEHDETAMSPDAEEVEEDGVGRVVLLASEFQEIDVITEWKGTPGIARMPTPTAQRSPYPPKEDPQVSNSDDMMAIDPIFTESDTVQAEFDVSLDMEEDTDLLKKFLPPPPTGKCPQELQDKINKFLALKRSGKSFNAELRNMKAYRNPDFLQHAVRYQEINQTGTCFSKDVFDPQGYDKSDYYDQIEADMKRELERRELERKRSPKVDFISGGTQPSLTLPPMPKVNVIPVAAGNVSSVTVSGSLPASIDTSAKDSRQNKKSKWDKVDSDSRNPLPQAGHDSQSTANSHAALLSAANAGAGYTAFAQQKRKEAEEKRSSDRKLEKRS